MPYETVTADGQVRTAWNGDDALDILADLRSKGIEYQHYVVRDIGDGREYRRLIGVSPWPWKEKA